MPAWLLRVARRPTVPAWLLRVARADVSLIGTATLTVGGRTAVRSAQVAGSGLTATGSGFGHAERMYRTLGAPDSLGADSPLLGVALVAQRLSTAIGDCWCISMVLGAAIPLRRNSRQYSLLDINVVTGRVPIKLKLCNFTLQK